MQALQSGSRDLLAEAFLKTGQLNRLAKRGLSRTHTGYYYIAHYPPLRAMKEVTTGESAALIEQLAGQTFETYLHFPFCEQLCSFCHFHKETSHKAFSLREQSYLRLVKNEVALYKSLLGRIPARSFYIGGGTPSLISNNQLADIMAFLSKEIDISADAEMKFELFPRDYSSVELDEKFSILRHHNFTDLVIDLESGNQTSLDYVGRGSTSVSAYLRLVDKAISRGFESIVTALILGMPHETFQSLENTLGILCDIPQLKVINTFPLIIREPDPIHRQLLRHPKNFPTAHERDVMWKFARDFLRERGYCEGPISYFHRPDDQSAQQANKFECVNLLAFGSSAFGYWNGEDWASQHFNFCNVADYAKRITAGELPLWKMGFLDQEERARRKLIFGLANCKTENLFDLEQSYDVSVDKLFGRTLNALLELGLISLHTGKGVKYTEQGLCRLEEISYFLASDSIKESNEVRVENDKYHRESLSHHYFIQIPPSDRRRFSRFVSQQPIEFMHRLTDKRYPPRQPNLQLTSDTQ